MGESVTYQSKQTYDYKGAEVTVIKTQYYDTDSAALILVKADDMDSIVLTPTINLGVETGLSAAYIKDYSENSGIKQWLIDNGIIKEAVLGERHSGFVSMTMHVINLEAFEEMNQLEDSL